MVQFIFHGRLQVMLACMLVVLLGLHFGLVVNVCVCEKGAGQTTSGVTRWSR